MSNDSAPNVSARRTGRAETLPRLRRHPHHRIVIVGGGSAGISVAARLRRAGEDDVALVDPSLWHYYQPLWTLVGAGVVPVERSRRLQAEVVPQGVAWVRDAVVEIDPHARMVVTAGGTRLGYDVLVLCPGLELAVDMVPGLAEALSSPSATTNYTAELAPKTAELVRRLRGGRAVFCAPGSPIKCPGAPQKAAYLACDHWGRRGVLGDVEVTYATGAGGIFGVPEFARVLEGVVERYGIRTRFSTELVEVDAQHRTATFETANAEGTTRSIVDYDLLWVAPPQRAPAVVRESPLGGPGAYGWVPVDRSSLRHVTHPEVFSLGDVCDAPTSKTGAAIRSQAPVVVANVLATLRGREPAARYDGYAACPFTTARGKMLLAEFDYSLTPHPTLPFVDTTRERYDMWLLKRYGLPAFYWHGMLRGLG
ncbi:MAG: FAD/NAD(P)-binding oxidoreductase [Actinomycetota bacterium]|jgi:sulfide:quinone oxidoreductase|nr:FAD/NAD(P)-binding oxidoreductase [Actinomycetota bacterium]